MVTKNSGLADSPDGENAGGTESSELVTIDGFSEDVLRNIDSFESVAAMTGGTGTNIADVLGTGFVVLDEKSHPQGKGHLIGEDCIVVKYGVHDSETVVGKKFTSLHIVTKSGEKWIVNDGSTGIHEQCLTMKAELGTICPLRVPRGLRVSEYDYTDDKGVTSQAKTYYLNTSK